MANVLDGLARKLHADGRGHYDPDTAAPDGVVLISLAGMPPTKGEAIALYPYTGPDAPDSRNAWSYPRMQVRARSADPLAAQQLLADVFASLQGYGPVTLEGGVFLQDCHALESGPMSMGTDDNGRHEYTQNYQLTHDN